MIKKTNSFIKVFVCTLTIMIACSFLSSCNASQKVLEKFFPIKYEDLVLENHNKYGVDTSLIYAVIKTESGFDPDATSSAGACGLMQITPPTFEWLQFKKGISDKMDKSCLFDPSVNIEYGAYFLSILLDRYNNEAVAISAYNAGISAVDGWLDNQAYSNDGVTLDYIPYSETDRYVDKVISNQKIYREIYNIS